MEIGANIKIFIACSLCALRAILKFRDKMYTPGLFMQDVDVMSFLSDSVQIYLKILLNHQFSASGDYFIFKPTHIRK